MTKTRRNESRIEQKIFLAKIRKIYTEISQQQSEQSERKAGNTDRQTNRQTDKQTNRQTDKQPDRNRERDRQTLRQSADRKTYRDGDYLWLNSTPAATKDLCEDYGVRILEFLDPQTNE